MISSEWNRIKDVSNALEMFEGLAAGTATPERLAGGRTELRDPLRVVRSAARTRDVRGELEQRALAGSAFGRRDARGAQLLTGRIAHHIGCPGRRVGQYDAGVDEAV